MGVKGGTTNELYIFKELSARRCGLFMVAFPDFQEEEYDARDGRASGLRFKSRA